MNLAEFYVELFAQAWGVDEEWFMRFISFIQSQTKQADVDPKSFFFSRDDDDSPAYTIRDGVGIVPILGPIFNKPNFLTEFIGIGTVYSRIREAIKSLADDDKAKSLLLDIDSPGGTVAGAHETSVFIKDINSQKTINGYVSGLGASAAYWLMSGCNDLCIEATARVGSIGVVASFWNPDCDDTIEIVNTASPDKRPDITKDAGKKVVIKELDALADVFIADVATNRGVSVEDVTSKFGKGGCLVGKDAVKAGMVDSIGFFASYLEKQVSENENALDRAPLVNTVLAPDTASGIQQDTLNDKVLGEESMDLKELMAKHPDLYKQICDDAAASAVDAASAAAIIVQADLDKVKLENTALTEKLKAADDGNTVMTDRVNALEKKDTLRDEAALASAAKDMVTVSLAVSDLPTRVHSKVRKQLDHNAFISEKGALDQEGFQKAIDDEIKDWAVTLAESGSGVLGIGTQTVPETASAAETTDAAARMAKSLGIKIIEG